MSYKKVSLYIGTIILLVLTITACQSGETTEEKIYGHLEEAVKLETAFAETQNEIVELEKQEQEIFRQISELTSDERDQVQPLAEQAIAIIDERSDKIEGEKESLESSREEFIKIHDLIEDLEGDVKAQAQQLYDVMMDRYAAYETLYEAYVNSLTEEENLYVLLSDEEVTEEEISNQIETVNQYYEQVIEGNEAFNEKTVLYNDLKKSFYEIANIEVVYSENHHEDNKDNED